MSGRRLIRAGLIIIAAGVIGYGAAWAVIAAAYAVGHVLTGAGRQGRGL